METVRNLTICNWLRTCPFHTKLLPNIEDISFSVTHIFFVLAIYTLHPISTFLCIWMCVLYNCTIRFGTRLPSTKVCSQGSTCPWLTMLQVHIENLTSCMAFESHCLFLSAFIPMMTISRILVFDYGTIRFMALFSNAGEWG